MKKVVKYVDEDTLEIKERIVEESDEKHTIETFKEALGCDPYEFSQKYEKYKRAEAEFNAVYEPFKANLIKLHEKGVELPKTVIINSVKCTYVSPSTRTSIDTKKLKEEEPDIAKKYTKTTDVKPTIRLEGNTQTAL